MEFQFFVDFCAISRSALLWRHEANTDVDDSHVSFLWRHTPTRFTHAHPHNLLSLFYPTDVCVRLQKSQALCLRGRALFVLLCLLQPEAMFNLRVFDLICRAISDQSKTPHTGQTQSVLTSSVFSQRKPCLFSPLLQLKTALNHLVLMHSNSFTSNSTFPIISPLHCGENPPLGQNIVNLFIKQRVQYIFMLHISVVKTFHSIKHLGDHWSSLQRANSSPRPRRRIIQNIRHIKAARSRSRPLAPLSAGAECLKGNSFIVEVNRTMPMQAEEFED